MPGILPMKVIKVGSNAQSRIAQACDRCRSKKIRCDGVRPCCSQCANVGFECKTSDKLSRRAFPRGYTESLEDRVRGLETEVRELKDLLDEKDEKIDLLTRLRSQSTKPIQLPSPRRTSTTQSPESNEAPAEAPDDSFKVQQSPYLLDGEGSDSYFAGTSSGRTFVDAFKQKLQEMGRSTEEIDTDKLLASSVHKPSDEIESPRPSVIWKAPARMVSDRLVNVFFQEWAPLYPVLHKLSFLGLYEKYVTDPDSVTDRTEIAQLNLVFGIAALSSGTRASNDLESFEAQWKAAVDSILKDTSMQTLQVLILAQIFCIQQGDLTRVLTYKGISTTLSARLGLHQSQKRFALGTLTCETRKKVFWTLYTVDCFTAVALGLSKHIKDDDVHCEYPVDADDENISERGFQPTLPGESTKLSSALALFRAARVLSKVLEEVFPAKSSYDLSLKKLSDLSDELENWSSSLAPHLRLQFAQDKPSTGTISSRSPILSLTYHYIRALIHRPAISASLGQRSSSSTITLSSSCKSIIQIVQLLDERGMSFALSINRDELLVLSGVGLLFQGLNLESNSKMLKDNRKMLTATMDILDGSSAPCASEYRRVVTSFGPMKQSSGSPSSDSVISSLPRYKSDSPIAARLESSSSESLQLSPKKQQKAFTLRPTDGSSSDKATTNTVEQRRATVHSIPIPQTLNSQRLPSLQSAISHEMSSLAHSEPARSPINLHSRPSSTAARPSAPPQQQQHPARSKQRQHAPQYLNLDYLSFGNEPEVELTQSSTTEPIKTEPGPTAWERLLGNIDNGDTNIYDATYGGQPVEVLIDVPPLGGGGLGSIATNSTATVAHHATPASTNNSGATVAGPDIANWDPDLWTLCPTDSNISSHSSALTATTTSNNSHSAASVLSYSSDDGLSGHSPHDDLAPTGDWTLVNCPPTTKNNPSTATRAADDGFRAIVIPEYGADGEEFGMLSPWGDGLNV